MIVWNNDNYLMHYGMPRCSGRYKFGFDKLTTGGKAAVRRAEDLSKDLDNRRRQKEDAKVALKKTKIMAKYENKKIPKEVLDKKLNKVEIKDGTALTKKVDKIRESRDNKLAAKNKSKIDKAAVRGDAAKAKEEFKAKRRELRRQRGRVMLNGVAHPYASAEAYNSISGLTRRGKTMTRRASANAQQMHKLRQEKRRAKLNWKGAQGKRTWYR